MATFKTTCKVEDEENGIHERVIFIKDVEDEIEAESYAKHHFILTVKNTLFYGVVSCVKI